MLKTTMSSLMLNSNSDSTRLTVPKFCDNRSNWSDYELCIQKAMGLKGLWRHIEGNMIAPKLYVLANWISMISDGKIPAMEEQIKNHQI